jgi:DNA-binding XRE family transcriptional regulator
MPDIASVLKSEISRIARREVRRATSPAKKAQGSFRADIAALKRQVVALEAQLRRLERRRVAAPAAERPDAGAAPPRLSAKAIASLRRRLGLSAESFGRLIGTSGQSVYNWEAGKARPRGATVSKIASLKGASKRAVAAHLEALAR